jgi:hypothetical protein
VILETADTAFRILVLAEDEVGKIVQRMLETDIVVIVPNVETARETIAGAALERTPFDLVLAPLEARDAGLVDPRDLDGPIAIYLAGYRDVGDEPPADPSILIRPFLQQELEEKILEVTMVRSRAQTQQMLRIN